MYLGTGILSVLFGAVVLCLVLDSVGLYTVALFVGVFLIAWRVLHILAALWINRPMGLARLGGALSVPPVCGDRLARRHALVLVAIIGWS